MHLLPLNLGCLADHADPREGARWAVTGVELALTPGRYRVTATDTKHLVSVSGPTVADADDYPTWPALEAAPNGHVKSIIGAKGWKGFFSDATKVAGRKPGPTRAVAVKIGAGVTTMGARNDTAENRTQVFTNDEGKFPPYEQIIPKGQPTVAVYLDAKMLAKVAGTLAKLADDDGGGITLEIIDQYKPVMLRLDKADGTTADGLVMPIGRKGHQFPRPVTLDAAGQAEMVAGQVFELGIELQNAKHEIERLRAEMAALQAASTEVVELVEMEPMTTALAVWRQPVATPSGPVRCASCRKTYKYLKKHGQSCTRCLKKHGAAVVRDAS